MSSIAYVTDKNMIEFHRLNGNVQMNFWRPGASINFAEFHEGDLLFFLAKGTEKLKEKGIIGYGRYVRGDKMSPQQAWNRYRMLNGYHTRKDFFNAIQKVNKQKILPKSIGCLYLTNIVFFQFPIYLSELGIKISNRVESYVYLDKEDETVTVRLLEKAKEVGIDAWTLSLHDIKEDDTSLKYDKIIEILSGIHDIIKPSTAINSGTRYRNIVKEVNDFLEAKFPYSYIDFIKGSKNELFTIVDHEIHIILPLMFKQKKSIAIDELLYMLGRAQAYKSFLKSQDEQFDIQIWFYCDFSIDTVLLKLIERNDIFMLPYNGSK